MGRDLQRVESSERVDLTDFEFLANESLRNVQRDMGDQFLCDPARDRKWIVSGFAMTNPAAKQLTVTLGKAILAYRVSGAIQYGMLTSEGDATKTVDLNGWAAATYGIYVRFDYVPGTAQSRIFWDPTGSGSEFAQTINTRFHANWSVRVESSNPGDEWLKIGEVAQATMAITDQRSLYFEGDVHNAYRSGWSSDGGGIANDRNADRQQYGVTDVQMFSAAMRQCITDIRGRGLKEWYEKGIGGMNIGFDTDPTLNKICLGDGDFSLSYNGVDTMLNFDAGDALFFTRASDRLELYLASAVEYAWEATVFYPFTNDAAIDLGKIAKRWKDLFLSGTATAENLSLATGAGKGVKTALIPATIDDLDLGNATYRYRDLFLAHGVNAGGTTDPAAGDGIFTNGVVVGYDGAPVGDKVLVGDNTTGIVVVAGTALTLQSGTANRYTILNTHRHDWYVNSSQELSLVATALHPFAAAGLALGTATEYFGTSYMGPVKIYDSLVPGGTANFTTITGETDEMLGVGVGSVLMKTGNPGNSSGWLKIHKGVDAPNAGIRWIPYWENISP